MAAHVGSKNMPSFAKFVGGREQVEAPKSPAELQAVAARWHAALSARRK